MIRCCLIAAHLSLQELCVRTLNGPVAAADGNVRRMQIIEPGPGNDQVPVPVSGIPALPREQRRWTMTRTGLLRISLGVAILVAATAIYTPALLYTTSSEAILNARIITLGAPID